MKNAQIKMFESVAVLVVFIILALLGLTFYFVVSQSSAKQQHERDLELAVMELSSRASSMPELECEFVGVSKSDCFDSYKLEPFRDVLNSSGKQFYFPIFGLSYINISNLQTHSSIVLYDNFPSGIRQRKSFFTPILLFNSSSVKDSLT